MLYIHKQISSKAPILVYFVGPKRPSGNYYISYCLTDKTALPLNVKDVLNKQIQTPNLSWLHFLRVRSRFTLIVQDIQCSSLTIFGGSKNIGKIFRQAHNLDMIKVHIF